MSLLLLLSLTGCEHWFVDFQDPAGPCDALRAEPLTLGWYDSPLEPPTPIPVELHHTCDAAARVELTIVGDSSAAAFSTSVDKLVLEPGEVAVVEVQFTPRGYENAFGRLVLDAGGLPLELSLNGLVNDDRDDDGYRAEEAGGPDCDDLDASVFPTALEVRNAQDDDCDGLADEGWLVPGDLLVTEVWAWGEPWVEVRNNTSLPPAPPLLSTPTASAGTPVELGGWVLEAEGGRRVVLPSGQVSAGAYTLIDLEMPVDPGADGLTLWLGDEAMGAVQWDESKAVTRGASLSLDPSLEKWWGNPDSWCATTPPTPGEANTPCPPRDLDGDQWSVAEGDCDDANPDVHPGAAEVWDWADRDCNGIVDDAEVVEAASGWVDAGAVGVFNDAWLPAADHDGDGTELLFRVFSGNSTWILAVEGTEVEGVDVGFSEIAEVRIELEESPALHHYSLGLGSDVDGDGLDELVAHHSSGSIHVVPGSVLGDEATQDDASLQVAGSARNPWPGALGPDVNGDGTAELVFFSSHDGSDPDEVHVFELTAGIVEVEDASLALSLDSATEVTGATTWADWTGDGVDDLGTCVGETGHGSQLLILEGDADLLEAELLSSITYARVEGCYPTLHPIAADLDGDGQVDLVVSDEGATATQVLAFLDTPSLGGAVPASSADVTLDGDPPSFSFGTSLAAGDMDGDGAAELVVGSDTVPGAVHVFCGAGLADGTAADACRSLGESGHGTAWALGAAVSASDLDGDGLGDVSVMGSEFGSGGRVWFVLSGGAP